MRRSAALALFTLLAASQASAQTAPRSPPLRAAPPVVRELGCSDMVYSVVASPDGQTISVLFDNYVIAGSAAPDGMLRKTCALEIPLHLPEGVSSGVYRTDYRGFANLLPGQVAQLKVDYGVGRSDRSRRYHNSLRGAFDGDFAFTETISRGQMKRAGCGEAAVLGLNITLELQAVSGPQSMVALDTVDGAARGGVVFRLDRQICRP